MAKGKSFTIQDILNSPVAHLNQHLKPNGSASAEKKNKYNNTLVYDEFGNKYDSKKELKRVKELRLLLKAGKIGFLARQVEFDLGVAKYIADFVYTCTETGNQIVEDVKSEATRKLPVYRLKRKLMLKIHKIKITEV